MKYYSIAMTVYGWEIHALGILNCERENDWSEEEEEEEA